MFKKCSLCRWSLMLFFLFLGNCAKDEIALQDEVSSQKAPDSPTPPEAEEINFSPDRIHFDFDKYNIKLAYQTKLQQLAEFLKTNQIKLTIEGHCDERGTTEYNLGLGNRRANSVKQFLTALGIEETRITTVSYGEERPLANKRTSDAFRLNRRAELNLSR